MKKPTVYLVFTPLHLYRALAHLVMSKGTGIFVLQAYSRALYLFYLRVADRLESDSRVTCIVVKRRRRFYDVPMIGRLVDWQVIRSLPSRYHLVNFCWSPSALSVYAVNYYRHAVSVSLVEDAPSVYLSSGDVGWRRLVKQLLGMRCDFIRDPRVDGVFVTYPERFPTNIRKHCSPLSGFVCNELIPETDLEWIRSVFGWAPTATSTRDRYLVLSQPLYKIPGVSRRAHGRIFEAIAREIPRSVLLFKRHPRDDFVYRWADGVEEIPRFLPTELLPEEHREVAGVISVCSSANDAFRGRRSIVLAPSFGENRDVRAVLRSVARIESDWKLSKATGPDPV